MSTGPGSKLKREGRAAAGMEPTRILAIKANATEQTSRPERVDVIDRTTPAKRRIKATTINQLQLELVEARDELNKLRSSLTALEDSKEAIVTKADYEQLRLRILWREAANTLRLRNLEFQEAQFYLARLKAYSEGIEDELQSIGLVTEKLPVLLDLNEDRNNKPPLEALVEIHIAPDDAALRDRKAQLARLKAIESSTTWQATRYLRDWIVKRPLVRRVMAFLIGRLAVCAADVDFVVLGRALTLELIEKKHKIPSLPTAAPLKHPAPGANRSAGARP
jgi:hypothetical protein